MEATEKARVLPEPGKSLPVLHRGTSSRQNNRSPLIFKCFQRLLEHLEPSNKLNQGKDQRAVHFSL